MGETWLGSITCEKDLEVLVDHELNMNQQCDVVVTKVNMIGCGIVVSRSHTVLGQLYTALDRLP